MSKKLYEDVVSEAKIILTEVHLRNLEKSKSNKVQKSIQTLQKNIPLLEKQKRASFLNKLKNTMFETEENEMLGYKAKELINATGQLNYCLQCTHASRVLLDESTVCDGCIYGTHIINIKDNIETRAVDPLTVTINGKPIHNLIYNRNTKETIATIINSNGLEQQYLLDTTTGDILQLDTN